MIEPTKSKGVMNMSASDLIRTIENNAREELLDAPAQSAERCVKCEYKARAERAEIAQVESLMNAPAQSAEPQEAEALVNELANLAKNLWMGTRSMEDYREADKRMREEGLAIFRARLASKPSRSEAVDDLPIPAARIDDFAGMKVYVSPLIPDGVIITSRKELAERLARPSREEEMRTVLAEIERYARASLCDHRGGSPDVGSCPNCKSYLHIIELARAALAQGGARDEARWEEKR